jgi:2-polyprenyl-3-methyl-5-hydroxy-6-metoxy-1,4-benzoquinol methylase
MIRQLWCTGGVVTHDTDTDKADTDKEHWSRIASEWIAWARTPQHDAFWAYRDSFAAFVGQGKGEALDVGCGEGRIARELKQYGYRVTAVDAVRELLDAAAGADSAHEYTLAAAADLPFADGSFDLVVAYNMLMDVNDVPAAVQEMRRVLRPGGQLILSIVHPFADHGKFVSGEADSPVVVQGSYFGRQRFEVTAERDGLQMHFAGWMQPLEDYVRALEDAGLAITSLREPVPSPSSGLADMERWARWPMFLWLKARPLAR